MENFGGMMRHNKETHHIEFDSITAMATWCNQTIESDNLNRRNNSDWYGNQSWDTTCARAAMGYDDEVDGARKLMDALETEILIESNAWESSVAGCYPSVPEYLAGEPESMVDMVKLASDAEPLSVYIDLTTWTRITHAQYRKRGIATLALVMLLTQVRPVSLYLLTATDGIQKRLENWALVTCRVETAPLDLTRAAYALTSASVPRRLFYSTARQFLSYKGYWPTFAGVSRGNPSLPGHSNRIKQLLGVDNEMLYIPGISADNLGEMGMVDNPVDWINKNLAKYGGIRQ